MATAANPGIFSGGMVGESKMATLKELFATSPGFTAEAAAISGETFEERLRSLETIAENFARSAGLRPGALELPERVGSETGAPLILKPEVGQRGVGIKLIRSREQAEKYLRQTSAPLVAQRHAPGPHEAGIFY